MSATPSRIELTCEFIPSILSGPIRFATFVYCRHLFGIGFLLRICFVLRIGSGRYETRPNGSSSRCGVRSTRTITLPWGVEGIHITAVTMRQNGAARLEPHQPRPALCSKAQRPEHPPRAVGSHDMPPVSQRP